MAPTKKKKGGPSVHKSTELIFAGPVPTAADLEQSVLNLLSVYTKQTMAALANNKSAVLSALLHNANAYGFLTKRLRGLLQFFKPSATILKAEVQAKKLTIQGLLDLLWLRLQ